MSPTSYRTAPPRVAYERITIVKDSHLVKEYSSGEGQAGTILPAALEKYQPLPDNAA